MQWENRYQLIFVWLMVLTGMVLGCQSEKQPDGGGVLTNDSTLSVDTTVQDASPEATVKRLTGLIQFSPEDNSLYFQRSQAWYDAGNTLKAMEDIDKAIELNVMNPEAYYMRGFYHYVENQDEDALTDLKRAIDVSTENAEVYYLIGQIHFFRKEYAPAEEAYASAVKLDSLQPTYYFAQGFMAQERGRIDAAILHYEEALKRNPAFIKALLALHDLYLEEKKREDLALAYNERVMMVDSTHPVGRFNQGNFFLARAGRITEEERLPEFQVLVKLAISEFSRGLQEDANYVQAYYNRGYCYYLLEQYGRALPDFSTVTSLDPYNEKAFFMKASILEFQGDDRGALINYQQVVKLDPGLKEAGLAVRELEAKIEKAQANGGNSAGG